MTAPSTTSSATRSPQLTATPFTQPNWTWKPSIRARWPKASSLNAKSKVRRVKTAIRPKTAGRNGSPKTTKMKMRRGSTAGSTDQPKSGRNKLRADKSSTTRGRRRATRRKASSGALTKRSRRMDSKICSRTSLTPPKCQRLCSRPEQPTRSENWHSSAGGTGKEVQ